MGTGVRSKFNVAINGRGYMLRGAPNNPAYRRDEQPTAVSRLALSDLQYSDFSGVGTFFAAQTDWSAGIKNDKTWKDDAKFYYSTNIDVLSEQGAVKLYKQLTTENDFTEGIYSGAYAEVAGSTNQYVGTEDGGDGRPNIYKNSSGVWADIVGTTFPTSTNIISRLSGHKGLLVSSATSSSSSYAVATYNGSAWTDHATAISAVVTGGAFSASRCHCELADTLYVGVDDSLNNRCSIVSTADAGTTWVEELHHATHNLIVDMIGYNGLLYYILSGTVSEIRVFDPSTNADTSLMVLYNATFNSFMGGRMLHVLNNKLIITVPSDEIYSYDGTDLIRIFQKDSAKSTIGAEASCDLSYGGLLVDNKIYWGNLVYDGEDFFNFKKDSADSTTNYYIPIVQGSANSIYGFSTGDRSILLKDDTTYKATLAKNFLVMSEMSQVVSIDKLLYSITVIFDALAANENIAIEYSKDSGTTWTALTTMTSTTESTNTKREFIIPNSVIYNKLFVRIKLAGTTTTPTVRDVIVAYKPIPNYKNRWQVRLEMSDGVKLLNGQDEQNTGNDLYSALWNEKATKQIVNFEDIDYVECSLVSGMTISQTSALVDSTRGFPRQGRIRAVSGGVAEEMIYTSAETNKIKGITRGQRGTRAKAYNAGQTLKNDYSVYIERVQSEINWTDQRKSEHVASVVLLEA